MNKGGGMRMQPDCRGNMQTHAHVLQNATPATHIHCGLSVKSILSGSSWKPDLLQCYCSGSTMVKQLNLLRRETGQLVALDNTEEPQILLVYVFNEYVEWVRWSAEMHKNKWDVYVAQEMRCTSSESSLCNGWEKTEICVLKFLLCDKSCVAACWK